jgi:hypothetical protein
MNSIFFTTTTRSPGLYFIGLLSVAFFYYAPSAFDIIIGHPRALIGEFRRQGMGVWYELTASLIIFSLMLLGLIYSRLSVANIWKNGLNITATAALFLFMLGGIFQTNKLFIVFLVFILISFLAPKWRIEQRVISVITRILVATIIAALILSIYELLTDTAWAGYTSSSGVKIRRSSAFFYNPNVFGFWLAIIGTAFSILYFHQRNNGMFAVGIILCSLGSLLAASRSYSYLLILSVLVVSVLHYRMGLAAVRCVLLVVLPILIAAAVSILVQSLYPSPMAGTFAGLAWRLVSTPYELFAHVLGPVLSEAHTSTAIVTDEFKRSFAGRFEGRALDSGVKALSVNLSILSLAGFFLFHLTCFIRVWRFHKTRFILFCFMTIFFILCGLFMSYSVLPLWLSWAAIVAMFQYVEISGQEAPN